MIVANPKTALTGVARSLSTLMQWHPTVKTERTTYVFRMSILAVFQRTRSYVSSPRQDRPQHQSWQHTHLLNTCTEQRNPID